LKTAGFAAFTDLPDEQGREWHSLVRVEADRFFLLGGRPLNKRTWMFDYRWRVSAIKRVVVAVVIVVVAAVVASAVVVVFVVVVIVAAVVVLVAVAAAAFGMLAVPQMYNDVSHSTARKKSRRDSACFSHYGFRLRSSMHSTEILKEKLYSLHLIIRTY
jgi:hypothetical protein